MDDCKRFQDLILTDYVDQQWDINIKGQMETHLSTCPHCRRFAEEVQKNLIVPFEKTEPQAVPPYLWSKIKERLEVLPGPSMAFKDQLSRWISSSFFPALAPALVSLILFVLIGSVFFHNFQVKQARDKEQGEYLLYVLGSPDAIGDGDANGLGTPIEKFFL